MSHHSVKDFKLIVQTVKASCCPDALESDEVVSTLPCWWRFWFNSKLQPPKCIDFPQTIKHCYWPFLDWIVLTLESVYLRWERVVKRSSGMSEKMGDGICTQNIWNRFLAIFIYGKLFAVNYNLKKTFVDTWNISEQFSPSKTLWWQFKSCFEAICISGKPLVAEFPWSQDPLGCPLPLLGSPVSIICNDFNVYTY